MLPIANPIVSEDAKEAVSEVLDSGHLSGGGIVEAFEREFADYVGTDHAIATASGTAALHVMLEGYRIGAGDRVITTPFSFVSTANAIHHASAEPVFADVKRDTFNLNPDRVKERATAVDNVAAVMPVHLYGLPAAMKELRDITEQLDVPLLTDAAQAHGGAYKGATVGSLGDAAAFSFYPTKNMTTGEGGMVTTDDDEVAARITRFIDHGRTNRYEFREIGYNYRMTNIQAAIGREQLRRLPEWCDTRQANAERLTAELAPCGSVETPPVPKGRTHAFHQYTIRTQHRERLVNALTDADIGYGVYYPKPIPDQPAYRDHATPPEAYETARELSGEVLSLPVHPSVGVEETKYVGAVARDALEGSA